MINGKRTATVKSQNYSTISHLNKQAFHDMLGRFPQIKSKLKKQILEYNDKWKLYTLRLLRNVDYFEDLKDDILREIAYHMKEEYFEANSTIFNFGDKSDKVYFICTGMVNVYLPGKGGKKVFLDDLRLGSSIGAYSILGEQTRIFSTIASTNVLINYITKSDIIKLKFTHPSIFKNIKLASLWVQ